MHQQKYELLIGFGICFQYLNCIKFDWVVLWLSNTYSINWL